MGGRLDQVAWAPTHRTRGGCMVTRSKASGRRPLWAEFFAAQPDAIEGAHVSRREGVNDR